MNVILQINEHWLSMRPRSASTPCRASSLQPPVSSLIPSRPGISLLEVLISMFVLLFGLMGVAAIFPVGNHYATQGEKYDRDVALVDAAFSELKARGLLRPENWLYASVPDTFGGPPIVLSSPPIAPVIHQFGSAKGQFTIGIPAMPGGNVAHPGYAFVIDPLGAAAAAEAGIEDAWAFPWFNMQDFNAGNPVANTAMPDEWRGASNNPGLSGQNWPIRRVGIDVNPHPGNGATNPGQNNVMRMPTAVAQTIFQLRDDLSVELPQQNDRPGIQRWQVYDSGTPEDPFDDVPLARGNVGNYTWLATVVPGTADGAQESSDALAALQPAHPAYGQRFYDVSVAVFYKRNPTPSAATERVLRGELLPGGQLAVYDLNDYDAVDAACDGIRPGQWIAVAGVLPATRKNGTATPAQLLLKWYRVLSIDDETQDNVPVHPNPQSIGIQSTTNGRYLMLEGPDWPNPAGLSYIPNLQVFLLPGVIGVTTRSVRMEPDSPWTVQHFPAN